MSGNKAVAEAELLQGTVYTADVRQATSWSDQVHLTISGTLAGYAVLSPRGHAVAAACEASGVKVHMTYLRHTPATNGGGRFTGVEVAIRSDIFQ